MRSALAAVVALVLSTMPTSAADAKAEIDFVTRASITNLFVLAESRLADDHAMAPGVKALARRLIGEHQKATTELVPASEGSGAIPATALDADHQARLAVLQATSGAAFDKAYLADQTEAHSNALTLYADYMLLGDNPKLKPLAIRMIPVTQHQLDAVQALVH